MYLEIDMGNTRIKWRVRQDKCVLARGTVETVGNFDGLKLLLNPYKRDLCAIWIASVVSEELEQKLEAWLINNISIKPVFIKSCAEIAGVRSGYRDPLSLGVDRWLAMVAAYQSLRQACIVVSLGTAATVDLIDKTGKHLGGFIAPGLSLMIASITGGARRIPIIEDEIALSEQPGVSTSLAICGGCTSMLKGLVDNAVEQMHQSTGSDMCALIFTGGNAPQLATYYPSAQLANDLVMDGMAYVMQDLLGGRH